MIEYKMRPCPFCGETRVERIIRPALSGEFCIDHIDAVFRIRSSLTWKYEFDAVKAWNNTK